MASNTKRPPGSLCGVKMRVEIRRVEVSARSIRTLIRSLVAMGVIASGVIGSPWPAQASAIRHGTTQAPQTTSPAPTSGNPKLVAHDSPRPAARRSVPQVASGNGALECGPGWRTAPTPDPAGVYRELNALGAASGTDIWAVGDYANAAGVYRTLAEHWNGYGWSIVPTPNVGAGNNFLLSVAAIASNDAWAVGASRQSSTSLAQTLIEHW